MLVAIDARPALDARKTGVGYYAKHIVRSLPRADPEMTVTAWYLHARGVLRPRRFFADVTAPNFSERSSPFPARLFEPISSHLAVPRLEWFCDFDVLLATNFLPPATRSAGVVMVVHDLAFRLFPETAPQADARWRRRFEEWLDRAARVIVPSASAKGDLVRLLGADEDRVDSVHHGVDADAFHPVPESAIQATRQRFGIRGPYVLFVGGIEPRKNLPTLVRAYAKLGPDASLVLAGGPVRWYPKAVDDLDTAIGSLPGGIRERIVRTGYVSGAEKLALLSGATLFAYPSRYEGFGMPVLEAMACGTPVLTSTVSSLPEVAGDAAILADPENPESIAGGMDELLMDEDLRNRLAGAGLARAASFTWEKTAKATAISLRRASETAG